VAEPACETDTGCVPGGLGLIRLLIRIPRFDYESGPFKELIERKNLNILLTPLELEAC